jgi:hypothetical protein
MSKERRQRLPYCWCCGGPRTHKRKVCAACHKLGPVELACRQHERNIDRLTTWDGLIQRKQRRAFETYLIHPDPRVRAYAEQVRARDEARRREDRAAREADEASFEALHDPWRFFGDGLCVDPDERLEDDDEDVADLGDVLGAPAGVFEQFLA